MLKDAVKKAATSTKNFVTDHKVAIAVVATATVTVAAARFVGKSYRETVDTFLAEKGLTDEFNMLFINPEDIVN